MAQYVHGAALTRRMHFLGTQTHHIASIFFQDHSLPFYKMLITEIAPNYFGTGSFHTKNERLNPNIGFHIKYYLGPLFRSHIEPPQEGQEPKNVPSKSPP